MYILFYPFEIFKAEIIWPKGTHFFPFTSSFEVETKDKYISFSIFVHFLQLTLYFRGVLSF